MHFSAVFRALYKASWSSRFMFSATRLKTNLFLLLFSCHLLRILMADSVNGTVWRLLVLINILRSFPFLQGQYAPIVKIEYQ